MSDTIPTEVPVTIGDGDKTEIFNFKVPSPRDFAKIGSRALAFRRQDDPGAMGSEFGLDFMSADLYRGMALMELLLVSTDAEWPYTADDKGKPIIDSTKFPPSSISKVQRIYQGFIQALEDFRLFGN